MLKEIVNSFTILKKKERGEPIPFDVRYDADPKSNYDRLVERINNGKKIMGEYPINVQIQTVSACNAKCAFCPYYGSWQQENPGRMTWETYEKIINGLTHYRIGNFSPYLENEPTLDKEIFEKTEYALKHLRPQCTELSTNLSFLNDSMIRKIEELFPGIPHEIRISFHGYNKETYEDIMGLNFEKTVENVMQLVGLSQRVPLNLIIRGSGAPREHKESMKNWFGEQEYLEFWEKQLENFKHKPKIWFFTYHDRAGQKQLKKRGMSFDKIFRDSLKGFYCIRFDRWVHFLYTGEPILCCMDYNRETVFSKSLNNNTIEDIFSSHRFIELIRKGSGIVESEKDFICKRCISPGG